nr:hypothetical protein [uncultured Rhodopila sp.]
MKTMILAATAALSISAGAAFAQGTAGAQAPVYGSVWAANQRAAALAAANHRATTAQTPAPAGARSASAASGAKAD